MVRDKVRVNQTENGQVEADFEKGEKEDRRQRGPHRGGNRLDSVTITFRGGVRAAV